LFGFIQISLRGKQVRGVNSELAGGVENILALYDSGQFNPKECFYCYRNYYSLWKVVIE
jgi:hypothetical protein